MEESQGISRTFGVTKNYSLLFIQNFHHRGQWGTVVHRRLSVFEMLETNPYRLFSNIGQYCIRCLFQIIGDEFFPVFYGDDWRFGIKINLANNSLTITCGIHAVAGSRMGINRSEEHTSELQS